jgi:hypothetical protein
LDFSLNCSIKPSRPFKPTNSCRHVPELHTVRNKGCKTDKLIAKYERREPVDSLLDQSKNFLYSFAEGQVMKGTALLRL